MKRLLLNIVLVAFCYIYTFSQDCLPEGITFTTQEQIDNFPTNYPGCKSIGGRLTICGDDITNLNGLSQLTSANSIYIYKNNLLASLYGLHNIATVYDLHIGTIELNRGGNPLLTSLTGLDAMMHISSDLEIYDNDALTSLTGLENLTYVGMSLSISKNENLSSINSLKNLNTIGYTGGITWWGVGISIYNTALVTLEGLENLTNFRGEISISQNPALTSITGIENIVLDSLTALWIYENPSLVTCNMENLCNYLKNPSGEVSIYNNADGCDSPVEMAQACGITVPCLPYGNYYFLSQSDINNFKVNYPDCNELAGDVTIKGNDIVSLNGLTGVSLIKRNLYIDSCRLLGSLAGLDSMTNVGNMFYINWNDALTSLTGLDNLESVGWSFGIRYNPLLTDLVGLEKLTSSGGLYIEGNDRLTSLNGLDNLSSTGWIHITDNPKLLSIASLKNVTSINGNLADLWIWNNYALVSLDGLNNMTKVEGNVWIEGNTVLKDLKGLSNLKTINGSIDISYNPALTNLAGLENLNLIEFDLWLFYNDSIQNLTGLENLTSLGRSLWIFGNPSLVSLEGIENVDTASISDLYISDNIALSDCAAKSICAYLETPDAVVTIENNKDGCNSIIEVDEACEGYSVPDLWHQPHISLIPNPATYFITILSPSLSGITHLSIFSISGHLMMEKEITNSDLQIDISTLPSGFYLVQMQNEKMVRIGKLIKN